MDRRKKQKTPRTPASHRASVSFPPELYETLEGIARQKGCRSPGWCVTRRKSTWPNAGPYSPRIRKIGYEPQG